MVHAIRDSHPQQFKVDLRPAAEHQSEVTRHELGSHGVVCLASDDAVLWKHPGHEITQQVLDTGVQLVLKSLDQK